MATAAQEGPRAAASCHAYARPRLWHPPALAVVGMHPTCRGQAPPAPAAVAAGARACRRCSNCTPTCRGSGPPCDNDRPHAGGRLHSAVRTWRLAPRLCRCLRLRWMSGGGAAAVDGPAPRRPCRRRSCHRVHAYLRTRVTQYRRRGVAWKVQIPRRPRLAKSRPPSLLGCRQHPAGADDPGQPASSGSQRRPSKAPRRRRALRGPAQDHPVAE